MTAYSWKTALSADWGIGADWTPGGPPNATTADVTIGVAGSYVVSVANTETFAVNTLLLNSAGAGLDLLGTLKLGGATHKLTVQAGTVTLDYGGMIQGGTVALAGGTVQYAGGTLDGVTLRGTLDLSMSSSYVTVVDGITLQNAAGTGAGAVNLTGGSGLYVATATTLDIATVNIGGSSVLGDYTSGGTLTLGSHLVVQAVGDGNGQFLGDGSSVLVNLGTITEIIAGGRMYLNSLSSFANKGLITVGNGGVLFEQAATFANTGTINVTGGSELYLGAGWSNAGKINVTGSTIDLNGPFTTAQLNSITASGSTINVQGNVVNTGATLSVGTASALGTLTMTGTIIGGVVKDAGGGFLWNGGTLDGVTYRGTLDLSAPSSYATVADGIMLQNAAGTGAGAVNLTGGGALYVTTTTTLDNATISIGGSGNLSAYQSSETLTLGAHLTLQGTADGYGYVYGASDATFVNLGTITESISGGRLLVQSIGSFANKGLITIGSGGALQELAGTFNNTGTINVTGGGELYLGAGWSNAGTINVTGATIDLYGAFSTAQLNSITVSGSTVNIGGNLVNTGATLNVGTGSAPGALTLAGTITGGVVKDAGGGFVWSGGTLDGVTYRGTLDLSAPGAAAWIAGGITLQNAAGTGAGAINLSGGVLLVTTTTTMDNATVSLGNYGYLYEGDATGTLTLGAHLSIQSVGDGYGQFYGSSDDSLVNLGTITETIATGRLSVTSFGAFTNKGLITVSNGGAFLEQAATFSNTGTINVTGGGDLALQGNWSNIGQINVTGSTIDLSGTFTTAQLGSITASNATINVDGKLVNAGATLTIGSGSALGSLTLRGSGTISGGTVGDAGGGLVAAGGTLDGVTYRGTLDLSSPSYYLVLANGITLQNATGIGPGAIDLTGGYLETTTSMTLDNATISLGGSSALYNYVSAGTLTLGSHLIVQSGGTGVGSIWDAYADSRLINLGTISCGIAGNVLALQNFATITNSGLLSVSNGGSLDLSNSTLGNLAGTTLTGGSYAVAGASTLELSNNITITTLAANVTLNGAGSTIQSLNVSSNTQIGLEATLTTIAATGTLQILGGRGYMTTKTLTDNGKLILSGGTLQSAGALTVGATGALRGAGTVKSAVANSGLLEANGGQFIVAGALSGGGALQADTNSTLTLNRAAITSITGKVTLTGTNSLIRFGTASPYVTLESSLTGIAATGAFAVLGGRGFTTANTLSDAGLLTLAGGTLSAGGLNVAAGGRVVGNGTLANAVANAGTVESNGGILKLAAGVSGAGTLLVDAASTLELAGTGGAGTIVDNGVLKLDGVTLTGPIGIAAGSRVVGTGALASAAVSAGTIESSGGLLKLAGLTGTSRLQVDAGSTLELTAATAAGTIVDGGVLRLDGVTLTGGVNVSTAGRVVGFGVLANQFSDSGTVEASGGLLKLGTFSGAGALLVDAGSTLELAGTTSIGTLSDSGVLKLDGITLTAAVGLAAGGRIIGSGSVVGALANAGTVESSVGLLKLGAVTGGGTLLVDATRILELTAAAAAGVVTVKGTLKLDGFTTTATTTTIAAGGLLQGFGTMANAISDVGTIDAKGGLLKLAGAVTGGGALKIETGATLELAAAATQTVTFAAGAVATLQLDAPASFTGAVAGLAQGDAIRFSSETLSSAVVNGGTLTVVGSAGTTTYQVGGALAGNHFAIGADQHTITLVAGALAPASPRFLASVQAADTTSASPAPAWHWPEATLPPISFGPPWPDMPPSWTGGPPGVSASAGHQWLMVHAADHAPAFHPA